MIRRTIAALCFAAAIVGVVATSAVAGGRVDLKGASVPKKFEAGRSVPVAFTLEWPNGEPVRDANPLVRMSSGRREIEVRAHETKTPGRYMANVTVPAAGNWAVLVESKICNNAWKVDQVTAVAAATKKERVAKR